MALVPSIILGAMVWFGTIAPPSPQPVTQAPTPIVQTILPAVLTTPAMIEASAGDELGFPIALDGTDGVPPRSVIAIDGLPQGSSFSEGRPYGEAEWNLRSDQIGDLRLILPDSATGELKLTIRLIAPDDSVIADAETILKVTQATEQIAQGDGSEAAPAVAEAERRGEACARARDGGDGAFSRCRGRAGGSFRQTTIGQRRSNRIDPNRDWRRELGAAFGLRQSS